MTRLRVLVEVDGQLWVDMDEDVERLALDSTTESVDAGTTPSGAVIRVATGKRTIRIEYVALSKVEALA